MPVVTDSRITVVSYFHRNFHILWFKTAVFVVVVVVVIAVSVLMWNIH